MAEETETMQPGEAAGRNAEPLSAEPDTQEDVSERISKAVAEAKKEAEAELKKVRRELDSVKKAHMTEDEKKQADLTERERELAQREAELQNERSRMYAVKAIKKPDWTTAEITPWSWWISCWATTRHRSTHG